MSSTKPTLTLGGTRSLPVTDKALIYSTALTFDEYLALSPPNANLLQIRCEEVRIDADDQAFFAAYPNVTHLLVLIEEGSPETFAVLPVFEHLSRFTSRIDLRILCIDSENTESESVDSEANENISAQAMRTLTALLVSEEPQEDAEVIASLADADFPLILALDEEWGYQDQWGPHPDEAEPFLDEWMASHPDYESLANNDSSDMSDAEEEKYEQLLDQLTYDMRLWYNTSLNRACASSFRSFLEGLADNDESDDDEE